jgi:hypothetical protein
MGETVEASRCGRFPAAKLALDSRVAYMYISVHPNGAVTLDKILTVLDRIIADATELRDRIVKGENVPASTVVWYMGSIRLAASKTEKENKA